MNDVSQDQKNPYSSSTDHCRRGCSLTAYADSVGMGVERAILGGFDNFELVQLEGEEGMNMSEWAKHEVEIACNREDEYGKLCYKSALKAFESLMEDEHRGMSIGITKSILNRLIDHKPLSPITEDDFKCVPDIGEHPDYLRNNGLKSSIQCPRMSSLFREELLDGTVRYKDVDRVTAYTNGIPYHSGLVDSIVDEMFPIKLPYIGESITAQCEDFLVDKTKGDFDTYAIYKITKDGKDIRINRFFAEKKNGWEEITEAEYNKRFMQKIKPKC